MATACTRRALACAVCSRATSSCGLFANAAAIAALRVSGSESRLAAPGACAPSVEACATTTSAAVEIFIGDSVVRCWPPQARDAPRAGEYQLTNREGALATNWRTRARRHRHT